MPKKLASTPKPPLLCDSRDVLAYNLRQFRKQKSWSQEDLALECELDRTYVSAVERSRWNVSLGNIEKMARSLDVEVWRLLKPPNDVNQ